MDKQPPKWAIRFLELTCAPPFFDELLGDLLELFDRDLKKQGLQKARLSFAWIAITSLRWYRLRSFNQFNTIVMHKNHFNIAFRHAAKHRSATITQLTGLVLGLAAVLFIVLYINNELAYDQMHAHKDELYRVLRFNPTNGERGHATSSNHGQSLVNYFPELEMCRFGEDPVKIGTTKPLLVEDFYWADSTFFDFFTFEFIYGSPKQTLNAVNQLVITERLSQQLFGTTDVLGKTVPVKVYDGNQEFLMTITGIVKNPPNNSHIQFEALGSMANAEQLYGQLLNQWGFSWLRTYVKDPQQQIDRVKTQIPEFIASNFGDNVPSTFGIAFQPFKEVYLYSQDIPQNTFQGNYRTLQIFGSIGLLILILSLLNYINISTARAITRSKEVGIRKTLGSDRTAIIIQFIVEAILFTVVGAIVALAIVALGQPLLSQMLGIELSLSSLTLGHWVFIFLSLLLIGFIAGIIPSIVLSKSPMIAQTKSTSTQSPSHWNFSRRFFVGIQYIITIGLLLVTTGIYRQYQYMKNFDLGFDPEQLISVSVEDRNVQERLTTLKDRIGQIPNVIAAATTGEDLPSELNNTWSLSWQGKPPETPAGIDIISVDQDYFALMGIELIKGKNFSLSYEVDSSRSVILNEQFEAFIGRPIKIGEQVTIGGMPRTVIGVVKNHHYTTLHSGILHLAYMIIPPGRRESPDNLLIKLPSNDVKGILAQVETIWSDFSVDPLEYRFVDQTFAKAYETELRFSLLIGFFTIIAISISLVGLFGLINFIIHNKLKELSIRRILGARQWDLMNMLMKDFLWVFLFALVVAVPLSLYLIHKWMESYQYQAPFNVSTLAIAIVLCLMISTLVIFLNLNRASNTNPSEILSKQ